MIEGIIEQVHDYDTLLPFLNEIPDQDISKAYLKLTSLVGPTGKSLNKAVKDAFNNKLSILCTNFIEDPTERKLFYILAYPKIVFHIGKLNKKISLSRIHHYPKVETIMPIPYQRKRKETSFNDKIKYINKSIEEGRLGAAYNILENDAKITLSDDEILTKLESLHPHGLENCFNGKGKKIKIDIKDISEAFYSLNKESSNGITGWSYGLFALAKQNQKFNEFFVLLANLCANDRSPEITYLIKYARLIIIPKSDGGIRPISIEEFFLKVISKTIFFKYDTSNILLKEQFGVDKMGGTEPVIHYLNGLVNEGDGFLFAFDIKNAFNTLSHTTMSEDIKKNLLVIYRFAKFLYNSNSTQVFRYNGNIHTVLSKTGIKQGNSISPLLFSICMKSVIGKINEALDGSNCKIVSYLDDLFIFSPANNLDDATIDFNKAKSVFTGDNGLILSEFKCKIESCENIIINGMPCLGSILGGQLVHKKFLLDKINDLLPVVDKLKKLSKQNAYLLYRFCLNSKLNHLARTLNPHATKSQWKRLNNINNSFISNLAEVDELNSKSINILNLPLGMGGFGIFDFTKISKAAFKASCEISESLSNLELIPKSQKYYFHESTFATNTAFLNSLPKTERCELADNASPIAKIFHRLLPLTPKLKLSDKCISMNIRNRLLFSEQGICRFCFLPETHNHFEVCENNYKNKCQMVHNNTISVIGNQLVNRKQIVKLNPASDVPHSNKKADILVNGNLAFNEVRSAIDVTFASLANKKHIKLINKINDEENESENRVGYKAGSAILEKVEKKKTEYYYKHYETSFVPMAFLPNGTCSSKNLKWLQSLSHGNEILFQLSSAICKGKVEIKY
jgi:hypothetical protein